jgi:hypothetical protein
MTTINATRRKRVTFSGQEFEVVVPGWLMGERRGQFRLYRSVAPFGSGLVGAVAVERDAGGDPLEFNSVSACLEHLKEKTRALLTECQGRYLHYLYWHTAKFGFQPNQSEMSEYFGVYPRAVQDAVCQLARRGFVRLPSHKQERCLELVGVRLRAELGGLPELRPLERAVVAAVVEGVERHGYQPTVAEIGTALGISTSAVKDRIARSAAVSSSGGERKLVIPGVTYTIEVAGNPLSPQV